eukprot:CAMPEP_0181509768 /NCGR_PEP_ID=MMETSP1110-20121109/60519_1 /TAXON_ID=174948 /ORGANISM="Symbiodinium sp., Strain CCMP421" /LENGTH=39 /DNA_ID= /DNA_START= /DNA_END= /DNA_ORIENTATION=
MGITERLSVYRHVALLIHAHPFGSLRRKSGLPTIPQLTV